MAEKVVRGKIISSDGKVLAQTLTENGSEIRDYPYGRMFAHVVGYNDKGKSGLESVCNFDLLKSDANLMTQITSSLKGEKSIGDNVYTTLNTKVQKAAYYALQGQKERLLRWIQRQERSMQWYPNQITDQLTSKKTGQN